MLDPLDPASIREVLSGPSVYLPTEFVTADNGQAEEVERRESSKGLGFL